MTIAHLNRIGTAVPPHDIHLHFLTCARNLLLNDHSRSLFDRMAERANIDHRWSLLRPGNLAAGEITAGGFYTRGRYPDTAARMALYERSALDLALQAIANLDIESDREHITHLIVTSCTGFSAPGLDLQIVEQLGLRPDIARTMIGFMGCAAAVPALRAARDAVLAAPRARVLVVNIELPTLHSQETPDLESLLAFMLWGDGAAAALVSADPTGFALVDFRSAVIPGTAGHIKWHIGNAGFLMHLSGQIPRCIAAALRADVESADPAGILHGESTQAIDLWAVHAGGGTVLDAVQAGLGLGPNALQTSRTVLRECGNMSSATIMFVLRRLLCDPSVTSAGSVAPATDGSAMAGVRGLAMAFGPGMVAETFRFRRAT